jgi:glycosyltransferase involved in cell wall biosynthesis
VQGDGIVGVVIGDGPLRENLCGVENAIWLGVRSPSDVALAAVAADFLVHPSHSEGLSIAMLEAAFAGLPMITTDARGCIDLGRDGRALVVPVRDVAALAQAMRQAASGPVEMAQRAQHMLLHVRENYSLAANTQRLIDKYREILSRKRVVGK